MPTYLLCYSEAHASKPSLRAIAAKTLQVGLGSGFLNNSNGSTATLVMG